MKWIRLLGGLPPLLILAGPMVHDAARPFLLGMPFILGWIVLCLPLAVVVMAVVYRFDPANRGEGEEP